MSKLTANNDLIALTLRNLSGGNFSKGKRASFSLPNRHTSATCLGISRVPMLLATMIGRTYFLLPRISSRTAEGAFWSFAISSIQFPVTMEKGDYVNGTEEARLKGINENLPLSIYERKHRKVGNKCRRIHARLV